jgi:hypothetical protein
MIVCGPIFGVVGANIVSSDSWLIRSVLGALAGLVGALLAALAVAGFYAFTAARKQRDEGRAYARALEAHAREYEAWTWRALFLADFKQSTLEHARAVFEGRDPRSAAELDEHWRTTLRAVAGQLEAHGASPESALQQEIRSQVRALDGKEDGYGDNEIGRIGGSMQATCQNLWTVANSELPPGRPIAPGEVSE